MSRSAAASALPAKIGRRGREKHRLEGRLLALRRESTAESDKAREDESQPEHARRDGGRVLRIDLKSEVGDDQRQHHELAERRHQLASSPLGGEVFPGDGERHLDRTRHRTTRSRVPAPNDRPLRSTSVRWQRRFASA